MAALSLVCEFWIRKTIKNVTMVVPVLMTNCQVSEKPNNGPVIAQTRITPAARIKVDARPAACDVLFATSPKTRLNPPPSCAALPVCFGLAFLPAIAASLGAKRPEAGDALGTASFRSQFNDARTAREEG